jgi:RimK family alpha-L-glutamate ligase
MTGIIITNQDIGHNAYKIKRFTEEGKKLGISLLHFINDGSLAVIKDNNIVVKLPKCDFIIYLDKDIYLARILERNGYRLFNNADFIKMCDDKMLTNIMCSNLGINMPKTIAGPLFYSPILKEENLKFLDDVIEELGLPLVMKKVYGSLGLGVFLVDNKEQLISLYKENCRQPLQFQEYIASSYGKSLRVLIIDGKVIGAFQRYNTEDFRSNYGSTASSKEFKLNGKFLELATKISNEFDIEYAGIDFLFGENDEPILCEINSNAFFEEFEKITKINVAKLFMEMVKRKLS